MFSLDFLPSLFVCVVSFSQNFMIKCLRSFIFSEAYKTGSQADDMRIDVTQRIIRAPDYTSQGIQYIDR